MGGICMLACPLFSYFFYFESFLMTVIRLFKHKHNHCFLLCWGTSEHGDQYARYRSGGRERENDHLIFLLVFPRTGKLKHGHCVFALP